jgi:hypothetical protein
MANATIYPNPVSILSWDPAASVTALTETSSTVVTNSSGDRVYWTEGTNSGYVNNNKNMTCQQGPTEKIWGFSNQSSGGAQITLTIAGSGGGSPPPGAQGTGEGQGKGKGNA